jgi:glucose-6-phosphate isomerase
MVILLERDSRVGMHRHPADKTEIYVILEGQLRVTYVDSGGLEKSRLFAPWGNQENLPTVSIHRDGIWHEPVAVSETVLYLEIYSGPFSKDYDVEYR